MLAQAYDPRLLQGIRHNCGPLLNEVINDPEIIEVMLNPDGRVWIERYGRDHEYIGDLPFANGQMIISLVASALGRTINSDRPILEGEFPIDGSRFTGVFPPVVGPGVSFTLRKRASRIISLQEYLEQEVINEQVMQVIQSAVRKRENVVVVGGTSSGKTTMVNGIIDSIFQQCPDHRLVVIEDTLELKSPSPNSVFFHTHIIDDEHEIGLRQLAKLSMRYAPKRIIVGEVRDGAALEMLKLWNTGHPGGISTYHADSADEALYRLEEIVEEAGFGPKSALIGRALDLVIYMQKTHDNRRIVSKVMRVNRFDRKTDCYLTDTIFDKEAA